MNNHRFAEVLVREGIRESAAPAVATVAYPLDTQAEAQIDGLLPRIMAMKTELRAGNVEAAVRIGHLVSGRSARLGERRVAGLVRRAVVMSRFHVLEQATAVLAQAEAELISKN